jgi:acyl carrier protein
MTRDEIGAAVRELVTQQQAHHFGRDPWPSEKITDATSLDDLGFDSLDNIEFTMAAEERFQIEIDDAVAESLRTVGQAIDHVESVLAPVAA